MGGGVGGGGSAIFSPPAPSFGGGGLGLGLGLGGGGSSGRVSFADSGGSMGGGLRRRRGGGGAAESGGAAGGKENGGMGSSNGFPPSLLRPGPPPKASLMSMASGYGDLAQNPATAAAGAPPAASAASTALVPAPHVDSLRSDPYGCWVVVYGFSGGAQLKAVLDRFGTYGTVLAQHRGGAGGGGGGGGGGGRYPPPPEAGGASGGASNWTCLRYETPLQAEKALCQHGTFLGGAGGSLLLVGVMRVDAGLARAVGLAGPGGGSAIPPRTSSAVAVPSASAGPAARAILVEEDVLLGAGAEAEAAVRSATAGRPASSVASLGGGGEFAREPYRGSSCGRLWRCV